MDLLNAPYVKDFIRMCQDAFDRGWHEINGGNLSYRIQGKETQASRDAFDHGGPWKSLDISAPGLAGEYVLITGTGKMFHNVKRRPLESIGIVQIDETGSRFRVVWGLIDGAGPTVELPVHLKLLEVKKHTTGARVVYHNHASNIIVLTFLLPLKTEIITRELWETITECIIVFPQGVGVVPWMNTGGAEAALKTAALAEKQNVILWAHHGMFCCGKGFDEAFGLAHLMDKAADIWLKIHSAAPGRRQTITADNFRELVEQIGLAVDEKYLYEKKEA